jgi:hypothetical protein
MNPVIQALVPFVNTPANLIGYSLDQTSLGQITHLRTTLRQITGTPAERADVGARLIIASGMFAMVNSLYEEQIITGSGPSNYNVRRAWEGTGWRANSLKIGDEYYSLSRTDPLGLSLGIIASTLDYYHETNTNADQSTVMVAGVLSTAELLKDRSFLSGFADAMAIIDGGSKSLKAAKSLTVSTGLSYVVPNIMRDFREGTDPYRRELAYDPNTSGGMWTRVEKQLKNAVPILSKDVPAAMDWKGEPIINLGNAYWRGLVPIKISGINQDTASAVLATNRVAVSKPDYKFKIPARGATVPLNLLAMDDGQGFVYQKYQEFVGQNRHAVMQEFINHPAYSELMSEGDWGPHSLMSETMSDVMGKGLRAGKVEFLKWLEKTAEFEPYPGKNVVIEHGYNKKEYKQIIKGVRAGTISEEQMTRTPQFIYPKSSEPVPSF